jgi:hypothetical protein
MQKVLVGFGVGLLAGAVFGRMWNEWQDERASLDNKAAVASDEAIPRSSSTKLRFLVRGKRVSAPFPIPVPRRFFRVGCSASSYRRARWGSTSTRSLTVDRVESRIERAIGTGDFAGEVPPLAWDFSFRGRSGRRHPLLRTPGNRVFACSSPGIHPAWVRAASPGLARIGLPDHEEGPGLSRPR